MEHPDYLEDGFYPEDYFVWPVGHSDYPDLTKNVPPEGEGNSEDEGQESSDEFDSKELDVIDPINHPVHWIPDRTKKTKEYESFDPASHNIYFKDDGPPRYSPLDASHSEMTHTEAEKKQREEKANDDLLYMPQASSERHPLPVHYDYVVNGSLDKPKNPLHPLDPYRHKTTTIWIPQEPIEKFVDYNKFLQ